MLTMPAPWTRRDAQRQQGRCRGGGSRYRENKRGTSTRSSKPSGHRTIGRACNPARRFAFIEQCKPARRDPVESLNALQTNRMSTASQAAISDDLKKFEAILFLGKGTPAGRKRGVATLERNHRRQPQINSFFGDRDQRRSRNKSSELGESRNSRTSKRTLNMQVLTVGDPRFGRRGEDEENQRGSSQVCEQLIRSQYRA